MTSQTGTKSEDSTASPSHDSMYAIDTMGLEALWEKSIIYAAASEIGNENGSESSDESDALAGITTPAENNSLDSNQASNYGHAGAGQRDDPAEKIEEIASPGNYIPLEEYLAKDHRHERFWTKN